jgi:hypothetical protein
MPAGGKSGEPFPGVNPLPQIWTNSNPLMPSQAPGDEVHITSKPTAPDMTLKMAEARAKVMASRNHSAPPPAAPRAMLAHPPTPK